MLNNFLFTLVQDENPDYTSDNPFYIESEASAKDYSTPVPPQQSSGMGIILLIIIATIALVFIVRAIGKKSKNGGSNIQNRMNSFDSVSIRSKYNSFHVADDGTIVRGQKESAGTSSSLYVVESQNEQKEALALIQESADAGIAEAQYYLGLCYEQGAVVPKDIEEAKKWYRLAAGQSYPQAKFRLGKLMMEDKQ